MNTNSIRKFLFTTDVARNRYHQCNKSYGE